MTNLSTTSKQLWLTRGRVLLGLPLALGVVVSAAVVFVAVFPAFKSIRALEQRRDLLQALQHQQPELERELSLREAELRTAEAKQALLVGLLAGSDSVQTFLAMLNQQAVASGVQIKRYELLKPAALSPLPEADESRRGNTESKGISELAQDAWQVLGYRKSSVALEVSGPYGGLHTFLQRMEALELLVESSDLQIEAADEEKDVDSDQSAAALRTRLTLKLSFYDMAPVVDLPQDGSKSSPS